MSARWVTGTALTGAVLLAAGAAVGLALAPEPVPAGLTATARATTFPVDTSQFDDGRTIPAKLVVPAGSSLAVDDAGRVTSSHCTAGTQLASGTSPLTIDDRPVIALATDVPLWRDLAIDARGADVESLQRELARLGADVEPTGFFGYSTRDAVRALFVEAGVARPDGTLPIASVLWLASPEVTIASCPLEVGSKATGGEVATTTGGVPSLRLEVPGGLTAGDRVVDVDGVTGPVDDKGVVTDPEVVAAVREATRYAPAGEDGSVPPTDVRYLLATPVETTLVPPNALFGLADGAGCVSSGGVTYPVRVLASSLGKASVEVVDGTVLSTVDVGPDLVDRPCA